MNTRCRHQIMSVPEEGTIQLAPIAGFFNTMWKAANKRLQVVEDNCCCALVHYNVMLWGHSALW